MKAIEMIGRTFGRATVIDQAENKGKRKQYLCACICGSKFIALGENLRSLHTQSCGCYMKSQITKALKTHGESISTGNTPEYKTWVQMKGRCNNPSNRRYSQYGGRGIKVCERWNSFENFLADMGRRPSDKHSIDRIDVNGSYEPGNCRWATIEEQANNKRNSLFITYKGETKTLAEWSKLTGLNYGTLQDRIAHNWPVEELLTYPANRNYRRPRH